ncbi:cobalt transport protein [Coriobacterium glomerans PW2]|uniref:Cobalt transport protein n=1 Tax=Coriobacterium glomerans (strain ATCC 49209 / DSM 20642 / JCM 10262 / PW2) TaxID=700015 RepID=F2NBN7_CORGP|nr:energy-coupling factor transporter transmembrane component T [Coriobacterium glomerans]AEB06846.1 cobalt transport protein [Coriobacterium glomerans PW2]
MLDVIDYIPGTTLPHRLNPVAKLAFAVAIILATLLASTYPMLVSLIALTIALGLRVRAGRRLKDLLKLIAPVAIVMLVLQLAFVRTGSPVIGFITDDGLISGSKASLRLIGVALPLIVMLSVTRLTDLANSCVENLHVPYRYAFAFTTALRFIPLLTREMNAIMEAQTARGARFDTAMPLKKLRLMLPVCIPLLVISVGKTDSIALAAEQRGFYLRTRSSSFCRYPMKSRDAAVLVCALALLVSGVLL